MTVLRMLSASLLLAMTPALARTAETIVPRPWTALTPLLAGTYAGTCTATTPTSAGKPVAIVIGADGKVRAPGIAVDIGDSVLLHAERFVRNGVPSTSVALGSLDERTSLTLGGAVARVRDGELAAECQGVRLRTALSAPLLAVALAARLDAAGTIACREKTSGPLQDTPFHIAQGRATLGKRTFDFARAESERVLSHRNGGYQYDTVMPGQQGFVAFYSAGGQLRAIGVALDEMNMITCGETP